MSLILCILILPINKLFIDLCVLFLLQALLRVGLDLGLPVIPTVVSFASEAHAREGAQNLGLRSARSAYTLIRLRQGALEKPSSAGSVAIGVCSVYNLYFSSTFLFWSLP